MNLKTDSFFPGSNRFSSSMCALFGGLFLACAITAQAINSSPLPVALEQPDGTRITLRVKGDEFTHWFEDADGFAVVRNNGGYVYAQRRADGGLEPTALLVGRDNPRAAGLQERLRPSPQFLRGERQRLNAHATIGPNGQVAAAAASPSANIARIAPLGTVKNLVILCRFSDHTPGVHGRSREDYNTLMNTIGGHPTIAPSGSLKDFYLEASYGACTVDSTVVAWVTLPHTESYYANGLDGFGFYPQNAQGMVKDALDAADALVNFGQFDTDRDGYVDSIDIIHSGYGSETGFGGGNWIWSHKWNLAGIPGRVWTSADRNSNNVPVKVFDYHTEPALWGISGTNIIRVGVVAHETGHFFGLPDLYDTDGSSEGAGSYCLMANSWGFDNTQLHPPHPSAWAKIQLGWLSPTIIGPGTHSAPRVEHNKAIFKITNGFPSTEYLLIENRQPAGFESAMPQGGLAIWHIDDNILGNDDEGYPALFGFPASHYQVALLQADGNYHLERGLNRGDAGDVYRNGGVASISSVTVPNTSGYQGGSFLATANVITNISSSASNMTFTFVNPNAIFIPVIQIEAVDARLVTESFTPTNRAIDPGESVNVQYRFRNTGNANVNVTATLLAGTGVYSPSAPKDYSLSNNGTIGANSYTFIAGGPCDSKVTNWMRLQIGGTNYGTMPFVFDFGSPTIRLNQNFESAKVPALPTNWVSVPATTNGWTTLTGLANSPTNAAFAPNLETVSDASLTTPPFLVGSSNAVLSFAHRIDTEYGFDGGVLEISVNNGPFTDIVPAGGVFIANGYNFFIDSSFGNPLAGRDAWTGNSTNYITTTVTLPASAVGQNVRLRWRLGCDSAVAARGWFVDTVSVSEHGCATPGTLPISLPLSRNGTNVVFSFTPRTGVYYSIDYKTNLNDSVWTPWFVGPGDGQPRSITNNLGLTQQFFRMRQL